MLNNLNQDFPCRFTPQLLIRSCPLADNRLVDFEHFSQPAFYRMVVYLKDAGYYLMPVQHAKSKSGVDEQPVFTKSPYSSLREKEECALPPVRENRADIAIQITVPNYARKRAGNKRGKITQWPHRFVLWKDNQVSGETPLNHVKSQAKTTRRPERTARPSIGSPSYP